MHNVALREALARDRAHRRSLTRHNAETDRFASTMQNRMLADPGHAAVNRYMGELHRRMDSRNSLVDAHRARAGANRDARIRAMLADLVRRYRLSPERAERARRLLTRNYYAHLSRHGAQGNFVPDPARYVR